MSQVNPTPTNKPIRKQRKPKAKAQQLQQANSGRVSQPSNFQTQPQQPKNGTTGWRRRVSRNNFQGKKLRGVRPPIERVQFACPLRPYPLPKAMKKMLRRVHGNTSYSILGELKTKYKGLLSPKIQTRSVKPSNYQNHMNILLFIEEIQNLIDLRQYDIEKATMTVDPVNRGLHVLSVPGLAEKRPSVLRNDTITASPASNGTVFKGYVHYVNLEDVRVSFHVDINKYLKSGLDIRFGMNRTPQKLMHRALGNIVFNRRLLTDHGTIYDNSVLALQLDTNVHGQLNEDQKNCVRHCLGNSTRPIIIFGPPGTGKTETVIHCALAVLKASKKSILLCAPSNHAADLICKRLIDAGETNIFRMNGMTRDPKTMEPSLKKYSNYKDGMFPIPEKIELQQYRVIVSTCVSAGYLVSRNIGQEWFGHIFIDEAGESLEAETLIPLGLASPTTKIILAGDPKQLGPVIRSPLAKEYNLDVSMLERIFKRNIGIICPLTISYRAHPHIMACYSDVFYDGQLTNQSPAISRLFVGDRDLLPNPEVPMAFHHITSLESRESDSPSWFNRGEINTVVRLIAQLHKTREFKNNRFTNEDIGIITPYRKQADLIRRQFHSLGRGFSGITVGTTENFQGREYKVIIISTVRSARENLTHDIKFRLGFLQNEKRLNVAISRAISLMYIVGNANLLALDPYWKQIIKFYTVNKCFVDDGTFKSEVLKNDFLLNTTNPTLVEELVDINIDAEWKREE